MIEDWKLEESGEIDPIAVDFGPDNGVLLLAFGGLKGGIGRILPFEFWNLTRGVEAQKVYVRDPRQAWYHRGLPGVSDDIDGTVVYLRRLIESRSPDRVVVVGNSAGGYAALLFGCLLRADLVLAFSPQTFLGPVEREEHGDDRWAGMLKGLYRDGGDPKRYNLKQVLWRHQGSRMHYHIHYPERNRLDEIHARRMRVISNVKLFPHGRDTHQLVSLLKSSGTLKRLLLEGLSS